MRFFYMLMTILVPLLTPVSGYAEPVKPPPGMGYLEGVVPQEKKADRQPPRVIISVFNADEEVQPDSSDIRRVPQGFVRARRSGRFRMVLPAGKYYLGVLFRDDMKRYGPPGPDEKFFFPRDEKGELQRFEVSAGKKTFVGSLSGEEPENVKEPTDIFTVEGTIFDEKGKPFPGALVMVREKLATPQPLYISARTGSDGRYRLKLPPAESYYLVARENLVRIGRPKPGDFVGTYGGSAPGKGSKVPAVFSGGMQVGGAVNEILKGVDITMYRIPDPEEVKSRLQQESESPAIRGRGMRSIGAKQK